MGKEIERKFLVAKDTWRKGNGTKYFQSYLNSAKERTVRVRTVKDKGYLTIKGITIDASRLEFEYKIPIKEADEMLHKLCDKPLIEKNRYKVEHGNLVWEIDEFFGKNEGLVVAEVELQSVDQEIERPEWLGEEVTGDPRYFNSNLIQNPFTKW
jgi:CYTH domain-containing protein